MPERRDFQIEGFEGAVTVSQEITQMRLDGWNLVLESQTECYCPLSSLCCLIGHKCRVCLGM